MAHPHHHHIPGFQRLRYGPYPYGSYPWPQPLIYTQSTETYCPVHDNQCPQSCPFRRPLLRLGYPGLQGNGEVQPAQKPSKGKCLVIGALILGAIFYASS